MFSLYFVSISWCQLYLLSQTSVSLPVSQVFSKIIVNSQAFAIINPFTKDEMIRQYHQFNGHEFEQTPRDSEGQRKKPGMLQSMGSQSDTTQGLNTHTNDSEYVKDLIIS